MTFDGQVEGASDTCAADVMDMHAIVYRARPDARSVLHTHSPAVTAFAVANRPLPCRYETLHRFAGQVGDVPLAPWSAERRDPAFLRSIGEAIQGQPGTRAVLLANHGVLAFAASPDGRGHGGHRLGGGGRGRARRRRDRRRPKLPRAGRHLTSTVVEVARLEAVPSCA